MDRAVERLLEAGTPRTRALYGPGGKLPHFRQLSERLFQQIREGDLAQAAFLHGVDPADQTELHRWLDLGVGVGEILHDRARLRSIGGWGERSESRLTDADGPELSRLLVGNVLPLLRSARALLLFITEQLAELDEEQVLTKWTLAFPTAPAPLPEDFRLATPRDRFATVEARAAFLRYVVAASAAHFGMWQERNISENLALLHERPDRFYEVLDYVLADEHFGRAAGYVAMVRAALPPEWRRHVRWEWHHLAGIERAIGLDLNEDTWAKRFDRTGFVAVSCRNKTDCYRALEHLHEKLEYIPSETRDKIGRAQPSGYQALHTTLVRRERKGEQELVPVHIVLARRPDTRFRLVDRNQLAMIQERMRSDAKPTIHVFAPDGRAHDVVPGSLVMNFAAAVHSDLLARLRGATVNRRYVRPNHMLHDGDVVWLDLADTPQHLPDEWFDQVPESTRTQLRKQYLEGVKPTLLAAGRRWLRTRIEEAGCNADFDDTQLERMLEDVNLVALSPEIRGTRSLLRQLGMLDARERGSAITRGLLIDRAAADSVAEAVIARIRTMRTASEVDVPPELREKVSRFEACTQCNPHGDEDLAATLADGGILVIHRALARCAAGAEPLPRVKRATGLHAFVIETTNRVGLAVDVLQVFTQHEVDVEEIAARRIGVGWGVLRVSVDFLSVARQKAVCEDLRAIAGVRRVVMPYDEPVPLLEDALPPRSLIGRPLWAKSAPFPIGPAIDDDRFFYGMDQQLSMLEQAYARMIESHVTFGQFAFISGPLRTGKSSLARKFVRLHAQDSAHPITVFEVAPRDSWREVSRRVGGKLLAASGATAAASGESPLLEDALATVRATTAVPIVIVIDEAVSVFTASRDPAEIDAIERFQRAVTAMPRVLVVWIGPDAPVRRLEPRLVNILQSGIPVGVTRLHPAEIRALLRAEKFRPAYSIELDSGIVEMTEQLTGGNPYWISHLAHRMYNQESNPARETVFTLEKLEHAREELIHDRLPFADRLPRNDAEWRVVTALLKLTTPDSRGVSFAALAEAVELPSVEIDDALVDLTLAGTVAKKTARYRIAAPILHQFLTAHHPEVRNDDSRR